MDQKRFDGLSDTESETNDEDQNWGVQHDGVNCTKLVVQPSQSCHGWVDRDGHHTTDQNLFEVSMRDHKK